jgi:hypothetical protein
MKPNDAIPPSVFARLQKHAVPLVDDLESVLTRILDFYEANAEPNEADVVTNGEIKTFSADSPPSLTHTKILTAQFNQVKFSRPDLTWNAILHEAIRIAATKTKKHEDLVHLIRVNFIFGKKENDGYRYLPDIDLSVQGQDSNGAWKGSFYIANRFNIPFDIVFAWRNKEDSAHPGTTGRFVNKRIRVI